MPKISKLQQATNDGIKILNQLKRSKEINTKFYNKFNSKLITAESLKIVNKVMNKIRDDLKAKKEENKKRLAKLLIQENQIREENSNLIDKILDSIKQNININKKYDYKVTGKDIMEYANMYLGGKYILENEEEYPTFLDIWRYFYLNKYFGKFQFNISYYQNNVNGLNQVDYIDFLFSRGITFEGFEYDQKELDKANIEWEKLYNKAKVHKIHQFFVNTPSTRAAFENSFDKHLYDFFFGSDEPRLRLNDTIYILQGRSVSKSYAKQYYKDSINEHCFLSPILRWAENKENTSKGKETKKKYSSIINKINNKWFPKFSNGFDETFINEFVCDLNINITISFPFGNKNLKLQSYKSDQKAIREFRFINTRFNHVDLEEEIDIEHNEIVADSSKLIQTIELNSSDMDDKFAELNKSNIFFQYMQFKNDITLIKTGGYVYKLKSEENDIISKFEMENNISSYTYDYIKNFELCDFISKGVHYTNSYQRIKENDLSLCKIKNLDQEKAYTQFKKCPEYMGFLGKITDFRACNNIDFAINNIGLYQINNLVLSDSIKNLGMNIFIDNNIYTSPELKFLLDNNCSFSIICGCWGSKFDFDFTPDMYKKFNGVSLFSKWTGKCDSYNEYNSFIMKGEEKLFENLKFFNQDLKIDMFGDRAIIQYKKNKISYKGHITAFITAYQRLNMLHQLMKMDLEKVIRVVTDGIYYYDHKFEKMDSFRDKKFENKNVFLNVGDKLISNIYGEQFCSETLVFDNLPSFLDHKMKMYYKGPGGTGKTHINLIDNGYIRKLYIAPSWKLATNKYNEYNINSSVLARMLVDSEERRYILRNYDVFIFDECSQYTEDNKQTIFSAFANCKIIFCGDVGFQLPPTNGIVMNEIGFEEVKEFNQVYRFEESIISSLCSNLRTKIDKINKINNKVISNHLTNMITEEIKKMFPNRLIDINNVKNVYNKEDFVLVSKNKCNVHKKFDCNCDNKNYACQYAELLKDAGEKYIVKKNTKNFNNGDITFEKVSSCILAHAFSIHSIQGETIKNKIFIDLRNMFEPQMLYTAISRAKNINQIYFITGGLENKKELVKESVKEQIKEQVKEKVKGKVNNKKIMTEEEKKKFFDSLDYIILRNHKQMFGDKEITAVEYNKQLEILMKKQEIRIKNPPFRKV